MSRPLIVAHRGACGPARENTLAAFDAAIALGADAIELDVRRTRDGVCVIHHDSTIHDRAIAQLTLAQLAAIAPDIPTLDATQARLNGRIALDIELKEAGYETDILALMHRWPTDAWVATSFIPSAITQRKQHQPQLTVGLLVDEGARDPLDSTLAISADFVAPHWSLLSDDLLTSAQQHQLPVWAWTVNNSEAIDRLHSNVAALITDGVEVVQAQLSDRAS